MEKAISGVDEIGARHVMKQKRGTNLGEMSLNTANDAKPHWCLFVFVLSASSDENKKRTVYLFWDALLAVEFA